MYHYLVYSTYYCEFIIITGQTGLHQPWFPSVDHGLSGHPEKPEIFISTLFNFHLIGHNIPGDFFYFFLHLTHSL